MRSRADTLANVRLALLSPLVRTRIALFSLPIAALIAALDDRPAVTACGDRAPRFVGSLKDALASLLEDAPKISEATVCSKRVGNFSIENTVVLVSFVLIAYALAEIYTSFLWQNLGRRVHSLDPRDDVRAGWFPPARWRLGKLPVVSAFFVWVPTLAAPLLFSTLYLAPIWIAFIVAGGILTALEVMWFERCLRGIVDPERYRDTMCRLGRTTFSPFGL